MKLPSFPQEICVRFEREQTKEDVFLMECGTPDQIQHLDAENGDRIAIYRLVEVKRYLTRPELVSLEKG